MNSVIVTRHSALAKYLQEQGIAPTDAEVIPHAGEADIMGKHVYGVLPIHLAAKATKVTQIPLHIPPDMRNRELTLEEVRQMAGEPITYRVVIE